MPRSRWWSAAGAYHLIENPVRFNRRLMGSKPLTYAMGAGLTLLAMTATFGVLKASDRQVGTYVAQLSEVRDTWKAQLPCAQPMPGSTKARWKDGAVDGFCADGDLSSPTTVMLVGDSHARQWEQAFAQAAREQHLRLVFRWYARCPVIPVPIKDNGGSGPAPGCVQSREETARVIRDQHPAALVISDSTEYDKMILTDRPETAGRDKVEIWGDAYRTYVSGLEAAGIKVGSTVDTPRRYQDPITCLGSHPNPDQCATSRDAAFALGGPYIEAERAARESLPPMPTLDINGDLCDATTCPAVIDGTYVYADAGHLSQDYTMTKVPQVSAFLRQLVG